MSSILIILAEMVAIAGLLLLFYNLRSRFGFAPLYILIGLNQFFQTIIATSFHIKLSGWFIASPGSVILFSASLFVVLLVYIKEGTRTTQNIIVGIVLANFSYSLLNYITQQQGIILSDLIAFKGKGVAVLDVNYRVFFTGSLLLLLDAFVIVIVYEFLLIRLRWMNLYIRLLVTMLLVLNLDGLLFTIIAFDPGPELGSWLKNQAISKTIAALFFASVLWFYLRFLDKGQKRSDNEKIFGKEDIFSILTYKGRFEKLQTEKAISDNILQKAIAEKTSELANVIYRFSILSSVTEFRMDIYSPQEQANEFLKKVKQAFKVEACSIYILKNETMELYASNGVEKDKQVHTLSIAIPYIASIIKHKKPVTEYDVKLKASLQADDNNQADPFFYSSCATSPLMIGSRVTGLVNLYSIKEKREFSVIEMEQLQQFAVQIAQSIENRNLFQQNEKHKEVLVKQIVARKKVEDQISESEANFRILFNHTAVLIWEEDFSEAKIFMDDLRQHGVKDLDTHFRKHIADLEKCASLIKVISINDKSKEFYNVETTDELVQNIPKWFIPESWNTFRDEIVALGNGATYFEGEIPVVTPAGDIKHLYVNANVPPGYTETLQKVIVSFVDVSDRRKAEQELAEKENRLRTIIQSEPECVKLLSRKGEVLEMNPAGLEMVEADNLDQVVGQNINILVKEEYRAKFTKLTIDVFEGKKGSLEFEIIGLKGTHRWLDTHVVPLKDSKGKIISLLGITRDITDRKRAEIEILNSKEQFQKVIENISGVYWVTNLDTYKTIYISPSYETITGRNCKDLYNNPADFLQCVHPDDKSFMAEKHADSIHSSTSNYSFRIIKPDGKIRWLSIKKNVVVDATGEKIEYGYAEDISDTKKGEAEKQLLLQRNKQTIETMIDGFILADTKGKIIDVNPAYCKMVEFTREELLQKNINELEASLTKAQVEERIQVMVREKSVKFETRHLTKSREIIDLAVSISMMEFEGNPLIAAFVRNITDQKIAGQKILNQKEELSNLATHLQTIREEERTTIAREIHDELGQQLTIVKMNLHSLFKKQVDLSPEFKMQADAISESINTSIDTVRKIASELRPVILDEQGLTEALRWQISEFSRRTEMEASISIETDEVLSDIKRNTQIFRIFQETLTNVARHAKATRVQSILKNENGFIKLLITDDGVGFDQNPKTRKKSLGLIMMRERANSIGAKLSVISTVGQGTSVLLSVPINE